MNKCKTLCKKYSILTSAGRKSQKFRDFQLDLNCGEKLIRWCLDCHQQIKQNKEEVTQSIKLIQLPFLVEES